MHDTFPDQGLCNHYLGRWGVGGGGGGGFEKWVKYASKLSHTTPLIKQKLISTPS